MNSVKKNYLYNVAFQILVLILPLVTTPYISRVIGPSGVGIYSYAYSVAYYFVIFILLGLNNYGNREIAASRDDDKRLSQNFCNIYISQFVLGNVVLVIYLLYCAFFAKDKSSAYILTLYVVSGILDVNWFFYGLEKFKLTVIRNTAVKLISLVSIFTFVKTKDDAYVYCTIIALSFFLQQVLIWPFVFREVRFVKPKWSEVKKHLGGSTKLFISVIAVSLFKVMDKIMIGAMTSYEQVGFYESSEKMINIPLALITALGTVMLPRMTNIVARKKESQGNILEGSILFAMILSSSLCFGIMGISDIFVPIFFGPGYETCATLLLVLLPSCVFLAFANVIRTQFLLPHKMDLVYIISAFIGAGVNLVINALLIPRLGAIGAAVGTLVSEILVCLYQSYNCRGYIPVKSYLLHSLPFVISGLIMFLVVKCFRPSIEKPILLLGAKIAIGILTYSGLSIVILIIFRNRFKTILNGLMNNSSSN